MRSAGYMLFMVLFVGVVSFPAFGQQMPGGGPGPMMQEKGAKELTPEKFAELKARILKMIEERRSRLDQEKACVEAAKTGEELRKCKPEPMGPMGPGGQFRGMPGMQQPPSGPGEAPR